MDDKSYAKLGDQTAEVAEYLMVKNEYAIEDGLKYLDKLVELAASMKERLSDNSSIGNRCCAKSCQKDNLRCLGCRAYDLSIDCH